MPLYDYACADCGEFRAFRPMSASDQAHPCPTCDAPSARTLSAPFLGGQQDGWLGRPKASAQGNSWRKMCGFGCTHANC